MTKDAIRFYSASTVFPVGRRFPLGPPLNSTHRVRYLLILVQQLHLAGHSVGKQTVHKIYLGARFMFKSSFLHIADRGTAEERLWRAVITKSLEEWICGPLSYSRKAEQFLFEDKKDFQAVCSSAGMDPERLRKRLLTIRARGVQKENYPFRVRTQKRPSFPTPELGQRAFSV